MYQEKRLKEMENYMRINCERSSGNNYDYNNLKRLSSNIIPVCNISKYNSNSNTNINMINNESRLDIAFLYSNPLIKQTKDIIISLNEPIDFEKEIINLVDTFKNSNKKITSRFEIANLDNLQEILRKNPKILHISCHGAYEEVDGQSKFYLYFEEVFK